MMLQQSNSQKLISTILKSSRKLFHIQTLTINLPRQIKISSRNNKSKMIKSLHKYWMNKTIEYLLAINSFAQFAIYKITFLMIPLCSQRHALICFIKLVLKNTQKRKLKMMQLQLFATVVNRLLILKLKSMQIKYTIISL